MRATASIAAAVLLACSAATAQDAPRATAAFVDAKGGASGTAELLSGQNGGVLIKLEVKGLPASQWVAFHVHETGTCDAATHHDSAGGHFNPTDKEHGYGAARGWHAGDMPNQHVGADGVLRAEVFNGAVTLDKGAMGIVGRALMIHAKADDYVSQPSGKAGDRLACAMIK